MFQKKVALPSSKIVKQLPQHKVTATWRRHGLCSSTLYKLEGFLLKQMLVDLTTLFVVLFCTNLFRNDVIYDFAVFLI